MTQQARAMIEACRMSPSDDGGWAAPEGPLPLPGQRAPHSQLLRLLDEGGRTCFHELDCDAYVIHHAGAPLEVWAVEQGFLCVYTLGPGQLPPSVCLPAGVIFGMKLPEDAKGASLFSLICVPGLTEAGDRCPNTGEVCCKCPDAAHFWS